MSAPEQVDLLVAGIGPGGCIAALAAAQQGLRTLAVDARGPEPTRAQLVLVRPGARRALESLGLHDVTGGRRTTTIRQVETRLRQALLAAAEQGAGPGARPLQVQWHTSVSALQVFDDHVLVTLQDESGGAPRQVQARHVVDACGGRLEALGRPKRERAGPNHWVLIAEYGTPPWWDGVVGLRDPKQHDMYLMFPTWERKSVIAYFDAQPDRAVNVAAMNQRFEAIARGLQLGAPLQPVVSVDVMQRRLARAGRDRVVPIGDAVGTVDVLLGAGMSTAIEDGADVGRAIAEAQRAGSAKAEMKLTRQMQLRVLQRHRASMRRGRLFLWARPAIERFWPAYRLPHVDRDLPASPPMFWPAVRFIYGRRPQTAAG